MRVSQLNNARWRPDDEFYTPYDAVSKEMDLHASDFTGAWVYCPCDTPDSNFVRYFLDNFKRLGLSRLTATSLEGTYLDTDGKTTTHGFRNGGFDFSSEYAKDIMRNCTVVVTNPPFSLYKRFIATLNECGCLYWSMCNPYAAWAVSNFVTGNATYGQCIGPVTYSNGKAVFTAWQTNTGYIRTPKPFTATAKYDPNVHKRFDSCKECINCDKKSLIPCDWDGLMGVPLSFIPSLDTSAYTVEGFSTATKIPGAMPWPKVKGLYNSVDGKDKYNRLVIRKRTP